MKKKLGYLIVIILGVASIYSIMCRADALDKSVSKESNVIKLFA